MQYYARVTDGVVVEVISLPDDVAIEAATHPSIASACVPCDVDVAPDWTYDGATFSPPVPSAPDLARIKDAFSRMVDNRAETERAKYITPGAGQAMAYIEKARQAAAYLAAESPNDADYPLLVAELGITGETVADVASVIDTTYRAWMTICARIEPNRIAGKKAIAAAEDFAAAQAAYAAIDWPALPE